MDTLCNLFISGTTAGCGETKLVEPIPRSEDSISQKFSDNFIGPIFAPINPSPGK